MSHFGGDFQALWDYVRELEKFLLCQAESLPFSCFRVRLKRKVLRYLQAFILYTLEGRNTMDRVKYCRK